MTLYSEVKVPSSAEGYRQKLVLGRKKGEDDDDDEQRWIEFFENNDILDDIDEGEGEAIPSSSSTIESVEEVSSNSTSISKSSSSSSSNIVLAGIGSKIAREKEEEKVEENDKADLFLNNRTVIEDETHGMSCMALEETPNLIEHSLIDFESELHKINPKPAYDKAQELLLLSYTKSSSFQHNSSRCYINGRKFRLRFLRCELFNVQKAAKRFIRYLDFVAKVYGEYALQRPICMSNFNREELSFLRKGECQLLPYRDQYGRRIIVVVFSDEFDKIPKQSFLKVGFYLLNACIDSCDTTNNDFNNIECHRKGVVLISFISTNSYDVAKELNLKLQMQQLSAANEMSKAVPIRMVCIHLCYPNIDVYRVMKKVVSMENSVWNSRTKIHIGNSVEWQYALQKHGIPTKSIPLTVTGIIKRGYWKQWLKLKKYTELTQKQRTDKVMTSRNKLTNTSMNSIVECPGSNDVVFKQGTSTRNYLPGNVVFQNIIESKLQQYCPNNKQILRMEDINEMIQHVQKLGGRFLKWECDKCCWINMCVDMDLDIDMDMNFIPMDMKSARYLEAEKEIQSKVRYAFRNFPTNVLQHQYGQKRKRSSKNDSTTTIG